MGAATQSPPSDRAAIDAEHAKLNGGAEGEATDTQSRATAHPDAKAPAPAQELPDGLELEGGGQLSLDVGGKRPTAATLSLTGGKVALPKGQFVKDERVVVRVEAVVDKIAFSNQTDAKTQQIVGCERQHFARIRSVTLVNANEGAAAPAPKVDRSQALGRVIAVLNEQNMTADEFVADQLVAAVLGS
jgi:hypothetical protein